MPLPALSLCLLRRGCLCAGHAKEKIRTDEIILGFTRGSMNAALDAVVGFREIRMHGVTERYLRSTSKRMDSMNANMELFLRTKIYA